jgi:catechol 2,3-dioxygenase-like lactoylglutathione lyase family enzyme
MRINHLDLQVQDVGSTCRFFERYFDLKLQSNPGSPALAIMTDHGGFVLVVQRAKTEASYPEGFHLGFLLDDVESVRALHERAVADGTPVSDIIVNGRGTMIYLTAPEGYHVEVACQRRRFAPASERAAG